MRVRASLASVFLLLVSACDDPNTPPDTEAPSDEKQVVEPEPPPPSEIQPRDAPAGSWNVEVYDERLVWLSAAAVTELVLEWSSGVVTMTTLSNGVRIDGIGRGSVTAEIGLRPGDVIRAVSGKPATAANLHDAWARAYRTKVIDIERVRDDEAATVRLWLSRARRHPTERQVAAAISYLGVRVLDETRRVVDRDLLVLLGGRSRLARESTLWRSLGVPANATVARIDDENLEDNRTVALEAMVARADAKAFELVVIDGDEQRALQYEVSSGLIPQSALGRIRDVPEFETRPRLPTRGPAVTTEELVAGVAEVSEHHRKIERDALSKAFANPSSLMRQARIVPALRDGDSIGFKLYGIRPRSLPYALGFRNGDTVTSVNGKALTGPDEAMEVYTDVREADTLEFDVVRRGKELILRVDVE